MTEPEACNDKHQHLVKLVPIGSPFTCSECRFDGMAVSLAANVDCAECGGNDEAGHDFCPVCDYCCGC